MLVLRSIIVACAVILTGSALAVVAFLGAADPVSADVVLISSPIVEAPRADLELVERSHVAVASVGSVIFLQSALVTKMASSDALAGDLVAYIGRRTAPVQAAPTAVLALAAPDPASAALDAIAAVAPADAPLPLPVPESLAYARSGTGAPETVSGSGYNAAEMECLAQAIYFEARGEPEDGQIAVAQIVINRSKSSRYPATLCGVVYQNSTRRNGCQFSFACDGSPERVRDQRSWARAQRIARDVAAGTESIPDLARSLHYHANYVTPSWASRMAVAYRVGAHIFYKS